MEKILEVIWSPESLNQKKEIKKNKPGSYSDQYFSKIIILIENIKKILLRVLGKPEHLKHKIPPCWSRRIK